MRRDVSVMGAKEPVAMKPSRTSCSNSFDSTQRRAEGALQVLGAARVNGPQVEREFRNQFLLDWAKRVRKIGGVLAKSPQKQAPVANIGTLPSIFREFVPQM